MPMQSKGKRKAEDEALDSPPAKKATLPRRRLTQKRSLDSCKFEYSLRNEHHHRILSEEMLGFYLRERQTEKTFMRKEEIRQRIARMLRNNFDTDTFIVGSSMNGLGMEFSDLDLTIEQKLEARDSMRKQRRPKEILKVLKKFIMQDFETDVAIISSGNDSYLKFIDESGIAVKVFVNRSNSVGSSKLLKSYTRLDRRVAPLIVVVKCWGRSSGLSCTKDLLNGYSLSLMAIHFLQSGCHPAVLPSLQILAPAAFNNFEFPFIDDEPPNFISENDESIGKLLLELFEFYSYRFRFAEDIISVREGQPIPKHECENGVFVEEPFDGSNITKETNESLHVIHKAFRTSLSKLVISGELRSLFF